MTEEKITFIVRVKESFNSACRCINSIKRQNVDLYDIFVISYDQTVTDELTKVYSGLNVITVGSNKGFRKKVNSYIPEIKTKYCMLVDSDSILVANLAEEVLKKEDDVVVFNISKANKKEKFEPFYPKSAFVDVTSFIQNHQSVWAVAFRTDFLISNSIKFKGLAYKRQALFLAVCLSLAESVCFVDRVLLYKWIISAKTNIEAEFIRENIADIKRAMNAFAKKGDKKARTELIKTFILPEIEESCGLPLFQRLKRIIPIIRMIWF